MDVFSLNDFHRVNAERMRTAFAPEHNITALVVCVQEEVGELAAAVLGVTGEKKRKAHLTNADVLDAVADAMTYLSLVASQAGCTDLEGLLASTFNMVSERAGSAIRVPTAPASELVARAAQMERQLVELRSRVTGGARDRPLVVGHFEIRPTREVKVGDLVHDYYEDEPGARDHLEDLESGDTKPRLAEATEQDVTGDDADTWPFAIVVVVEAGP